MTAFVLLVAALLLVLLFADGGARLEAAGAAWIAPTPIPTRIMPGMPTRTPTKPPAPTATRTPLQPGPTATPSSTTPTPSAPPSPTVTPTDAGPGSFQYVAFPAPSGTFLFNADGSVSWLVNGRPVTVELCDGAACKVIRMNWGSKP